MVSSAAALGAAVFLAEDFFSPAGFAALFRGAAGFLAAAEVFLAVEADFPAADFRPCPGTAEFVHFPGGPGVRVDSHLYSGYALPPYYDSLAAKLMVHAPTRLEAIRKMRRCLEEFTLKGFPTNAELSYQILYHPIFVRGGCTTAFLDECLPQLLEFSSRLSVHEERL